MCNPGDRIPVVVTVDAAVAFEGVQVRKAMPIDRCLADLVAVLDAGGFRMLSSCCGHGNGPAEILLADGRIMTITEARR